MEEQNQGISSNETLDSYNSLKKSINEKMDKVMQEAINKLSYLEQSMQPLSKLKTEVIILYKLSFNLRIA